MSKQWRLIVGCAGLGLAVTAFIFSYVNFWGEFDTTLYNAFVILCPPALVCIPLSEAMKHEGDLYAIWALIGLTNSGLYAIIGAAVAGLLWSPTKPAD